MKDLLIEHPQSLLKDSSQRINTICKCMRGLGAQRNNSAMAGFTFLDRPSAQTKRVCALIAKRLQTRQPVRDQHKFRVLSFTKKHVLFGRQRSSSALPRPLDRACFQCV